MPPLSQTACISKIKGKAESNLILLVFVYVRIFMIIKVMHEKMGKGLEQTFTKGQSTYAKGLELIRKQGNATNHPEKPLHTHPKGLR